MEEHILNGFGRKDKQSKKDSASVITRETVGMTLLLFGAVLFFITATGEFILRDIGLAIAAFFIGLFGFLAYPVLLLVVYAGVVLTFGKRLVSNRWILRGALLLLSVFLIVHTATSGNFFETEEYQGYGGYLSGCWSAASEGIAGGTGGGVILGLIVYPARALLSAAGAYVVFSLLILLSLFYIVMATPLGKRIVLFQRGEKKHEEEPQETRAYPVAFDELDTPARAQLPAVPHTRAEVSRSAPAPAPTPAPAPAPEEKPETEYEASRRILFNRDPASDYRDNLIYNSDSYFNRGNRKSSIEPDARKKEPDPTAYGEQGASTYVSPTASGPSYADRYTRETDDGRPSMPRKITEERPVSGAAYSYSASDTDFNYPQTPSYRAPAPSEPVRPAHDFYEKDVPVEDELSSAPNVFDEPAEEPVETVRPTQQEYPARDIKPAEPPREEPQRSETGFRSLFARPAVDRTEQKNEPARDSFGSDFRRDTFEEKAEEPARDTFGSDFRRDTFEEAGPVRRTGGEEFMRRGEELDGAEEPAASRVFDAPIHGRTNANLFDDDDADEDYFEQEPPAAVSRTRTYERRESSRMPAAPVPDAPAPAPKKHVYKPYRRPSMNCFREYDDSITVPPEEIERNSAIILETLAGFNVAAEIIKVKSGSSVTRYDIDIPRNVAVRSVIKYDAEIAMRLHARDGVNMYSNSEVGAISIEVPNSVRATVGLRSVLSAPEYVNAKEGSLVFAIGKDVEGRNVCGNIPKMTHVLVAGSTNSGKSVCLNAMIISLIMKYSPEDLRLILIDPKKVEFTVFDGLPHLMINEIIADAQKAITALNWAIKEMERRYSLFEQKTRGGVAVRNVDEYNLNRTEDEEKLPKIVVVVDELADLMSVAKKDIEDRIQRLTQKARAAGIHLVIATQRPSVDVITGVIKGNLPTRMAFRVIQEVDSRTILDETGAQKLLGNGDMLYRTGGMFSCSRVQGAFISSQEVFEIVEEIKANNEAYFDDEVADYINRAGSSEAGDGDEMGDIDADKVDKVYIKALGIVVKLGQASISLIQRRCSVGYNHAGKIVEWMEMMGYIAPFDGKAKARAVLLTKEDYESKYGPLE